LPFPRSGIYGSAQSNTGNLLQNKGVMRVLCLGFIEFGKIKVLLIYFFCYLCFQQIACLLSTMVAETASIVNDGHPNNMHRLLTYYLTIM
jgi:hypothetical protein